MGACASWRAWIGSVLAMARRASDLLAGIRVLDFSSMLAGPYAAMLLGGMGADVVKVEPPRGDPARYAFGPPFEQGDSTYFQAVNQDKRSVAIDLRSERGQEVMARLLVTADVLIHNLRPGSAERLGLGEEAVRAIRPDIVYCEVRAFGSTGPWSERPGMDLVFQGLSGHMSITGNPEGAPVRAAAQVVDIATGSFVSTGICAALFDRLRTGKGRTLAVNLLDVGFALQNTIYSYFFATGTDPERVGSGSYVSVTNCFPTADGYINVTIPYALHWEGLCLALGREDLLQEPRYETNEQRVLLRTEIEAELRQTFEKQTTEYWLDQLTAAEVPCGPVLSYGEAVAHPQVVQNEVAIDLEHALGGTLRGISTPLRFSGEERGIAHRAPPPLGWHAAELLEELGYGPEEQERLFADAIVGRRPEDTERLPERGTST